MGMSHVYLFIRTDLSREQQIIQASHVMHVVGLKQKDRKDVSSLVLIGIKDKEELHQLNHWLNDQKIPFESFFEPDINEYTAIATHPRIGEAEREPFKYFDLLRFDVEQLEQIES
jgi:hypothetical protein